MKFILATAVILSLLALLPESEIDVMQMEVEQHCEMVALWESTDGDLGWPDYNNSYERECK